MGAPPATLDRTVQTPFSIAGVAARVRLSTAAALLPVAAGAALWGISLGGIDATGVSGYGLLAALPPSYYAALAALAIGFALAVTADRPRPFVLASHLGALVVVLHATAAIVYPEPRYAWTYKHLGVIDYLGLHGAADRSVDIYNNWPGFFGLNEWFSKTAGIDPLSYAAWAQPVFELAFVGAVVYALRGVTRDTRLVWSAAWLFLVANWIGQDYLAPQAFGFFLSTVVLGLVVRWAPWGRPPRTAAAWAAVRLTTRIGTALMRGRAVRPERSETRTPPARVALAVGGVMYVAVVVSHQLSPILLLASVAVLAVATRRPPMWVVALMIAVEAAWVLLALDFLAAHFKLFDFDPTATARAGLDSALPGVRLGAGLSRAGMLLMVGLAAVGLRRRARGGHFDAVPGALAVAPVLVTLFQSYDGEGPLRVYLFALPWVAFFAAAACRAPLARTRFGRSWRLLAATALVGVATLFGYFGQEPTNYMSPDDVAVSRWYLDHTPPSSSVTLVAPNFPDRLDANYSKHLGGPRSLLGEASSQPGLIVPERVQLCRPPCGLLVGDALRAFLLADRARDHYVIVSPSQRRYARYYGLADGSAFERLRRGLLASPDFKLEYRHGGGYVFRYVGGAA